MKSDMFSHNRSRTLSGQKEKDGVQGQRYPKELQSNSALLHHSASSSLDGSVNSFIPELVGGDQARNVHRSRVQLHRPSITFLPDPPSPEPPEDLAIDISQSLPQSAPVYLPGDRVIFTERSSAPGVPVVYRSPEERHANPDRLNLDRRRLSVCPILEGEDQLRLLNFQHNLIEVIEHLTCLKRLIFLDLYDNQIEVISGLGALKSLRVLMLGKNRIKSIENLENLTKLDVLDLHGNKIVEIKNLNHLLELRVLNLAGNAIGHVGNLHGMDSLTELNLRRNHITTVCEIETLPTLQRLFLSFNLITSFEDVSCIGNSQSLLEVSMDGNSISQEPQYKQQMLQHVVKLRQLDMKRITDDERRMAAVMARKEEEKRRETMRNALRKEQRKHAISNAKKQWEVTQGGVMATDKQVAKHSPPEVYSSHAASFTSCDTGRENGVEDNDSSRASSRVSSKRSASAKSSQSEKDTIFSVVPPSSQSTSRTSSGSQRSSPEKEKSNTTYFGASGKDFLTEFEGDTLSLYGAGSLDTFDKAWGIQAAGTVNTICFIFIEFDDIVKHLHKVKARFPNVQTIVFNSTNISHLHQLNGLSGLRHLDHLFVKPDGNPVTHFTLWRTYVVFRLAHLALKKINDVEVTSTDVMNAEGFFSTLGHLVTSQLPQAQLLSLLTEVKKKQLLNTEERIKKMAGTEMKLTDRSIESVSRAALIYTVPESADLKRKEQRRKKDQVRRYMKDLSKDAIYAEDREMALQELWPRILTDMVHAAVVDMIRMDVYMKGCLEKLQDS